MSDFESDDEFIGQTSVLLGFAGKEATNKMISILDNHIGGIPLWFNNTPPPAKMTSCNVCNEPMGLLAQLYCPLDNKLYDRVIYVFGCPKPNCYQKEGSIKAIRGIHDSEEVRDRIRAELKESEEPVQSKKHDIGNMIFGEKSSSGANPFSAGNPFDSKPVEPAASDCSQKKPKAKATAKPEPEVVSDEKGVWLQKLIEVDDEYIVPEKPVRIEELDSDVMETGSSSVTDSTLDPEAAAIAEAVSDPIFSKFANLVQHNADQVLRYERPLKAIPYSNDSLYRVLINPTELPDTSSGDRRIFELQLMPHLISELETDDQLLDGMEWGTILVATSESDEIPNLDANGVGYVEEWVGVQWELRK